MAVEKKLEKVAKSVCAAMKERVHIPPLITAMYHAFEDTDSWYSQTEETSLPKEKILEILSVLKSSRAEEFQQNIDNIV